MNRRGFALALTLGGLGALGGCLLPTGEVTEATAPPAEEKVDVLTVGKVMSSFAQADPIPVSGVGLVVGLEGTGGSAPPGQLRSMLENHLKQRGVEQVKDILNSSDASMVLVSGVIPPGVRKNDTIDIEVTLPPQCRTTSLRGGYLKECYLFNYDTTKNLSPGSEGANRTLLGHKLARAEGPVLLECQANDADNACRGRVWGGGKVLTGRNLWVVMDGNYESAPVVQRVAERINATFHGPSGIGGANLAVAKTKSYLTLDIPPQYRLNLPRFMRVVRFIPVPEDASAIAPYCRRLEQELLDPATTITAALRLEALGKNSIPALKAGLQSEHTLVRFASAEAMAYLGQPSAGEALAKLIREDDQMRGFALTAMASLDEPVSRVKLGELLSAEDAQTRYGAFRALRSLDEHDSAVQGELLAESFWLHKTAPGSAPLVHVSTTRRAEIILFGEGVRLAPPFAFHAGGFTITAPRDDDRCTLGRASASSGSDRRQCSLEVADVLRHLAQMGVTYSEVVLLLRQAGKFGCLSAPLAVDALPPATSVYDLAQRGGNTADPAREKQSEGELQLAGGAVPKTEYYPAHESRAR